MNLDEPKPEETVAAQDAIGPLATLPLAFRVAGRTAVIAGGGDGAAWKAELLVAAGASVVVFATKPSRKLIELAARRPAVRLEPRAWRPDDLTGASLAILEAEDQNEARAFRAAAQAAGAPVNVVDKPEFCDFSFATLVNRSPLVVAVATDGASPVFGQAIRARIEALLPASFADWAAAARDWRRRLAPLGLDFRQRRHFWERFVDLALASGERAPEPEDFRRLADAEADSAVPKTGRILLVGGGPGDPDLLTLKAVRALQTADVVLYDDLAPPRVLEMARREARRIDVGKRGGRESTSQAEISALAVALALEGKTVVRLKGGDPSVFGRANEEIAAARAAGVPIAIVPGVTAATAAAAELGVSLSDRLLARRVQFVTARGQDGRLPQGLQWAAMVDPDVTTCVYMGVRALPELTARLIAEGLDGDTPAVVVENVSLAGSRRFAAPIRLLPERVAEARPTGPCLLIYGRALAGAAA